MTTRYTRLLLSLISLTFLSVQNPTGVTTLQTCVNNGAFAVFPFEEFVLALDNGSVRGEGTIITQDGNLLATIEVYKPDPCRLLTGTTDISQEKELFFDGNLAVLSSQGQQCYYHWLLQILPRLKILTEAAFPYDKIYLSSSNFSYRWQQESLYAVMEHLQIPRDRLLLVDEGTIVTAKTLLVPSVLWTPSKPAFHTCDLTWFKQFFYDVFVKTSSEALPKRIYISRSKAQYRRISNESELIECLDKRGFAVLHLEDLSIYDQAALFHNADTVVGPHGAGFTNLIFCKPGTHIIEIDHGVQGEEQRSSYKGMAKRLGCIYHPMYVDLLEETDAPEDIHAPINQDMVLDMQAFLLVLDLAADNAS
ncbi:MAG: glycosyltransferase family 61 protein [Verrucomicrobia bacterium]|nr:glycosyltransferase family 61 protein [Verrucomicrobiota bacterium]